ncbi:TIGR01244 family sulfur transferase [Hyphococcus flavus]|uniref:TIGR01244 family sulfur transferase n=1 Tax=Hyphococcus flavus TaxID=1866326 RepID=A0AAE9Z9Z5_9PROT|nr:TIGR01244 family sulfur transferase [Hyphococcus flavus]WDI30218.1 TIGR01244 family sulfur transferase [Hyphococcus flavus]
MTTGSKLLTDAFYVSPQLSVAEVAAAADEGFKLIVNNRPDGEMIGQPKSAELETAATAVGMKYAHIPVGPEGITQGHIEALKSALDSVERTKTLAFCRSGARSTFLLSYLSASEGRAVSDIVADAVQAGFDISAHAPVLEALGKENKNDE